MAIAMVKALLANCFDLRREIYLAMIQLARCAECFWLERYLCYYRSLWILAATMKGSTDIWSGCWLDPSLD